MSAAQPPPVDRPGTAAPSEETQNIATAITEISERATLLVREEIELAKAEMNEKASKLARGAAVGAVAGIFFLTALVLVLVGCAWLLYYYLPIGSDFTYFWGFFALALILLVLGLIAGLIAARALKRGAPPVPDMALEEARLIRDTVSHTPETPYSPPSPVSAFTAPAPYGAAAPAGTVVAAPSAPVQTGPSGPADHTSSTPAGDLPSGSADPGAPAPADSPPSSEPDQEASS